MLGLEVGRFEFSLVPLISGGHVGLNYWDLNWREYYE